jgi:hypothetical protein
MIQIKVQVIGDTNLVGLKTAIDGFVSALVPEIKSQIARRTPIKTGKARRGWQSRQSAVENKVPYIGKLEGGYSRQAPNGFVRQGISAAINNIGTIKK